MATRTQVKAIVEAAMLAANFWPRLPLATGRVHVQNDILVDGLFDVIDERSVKSIYDPTGGLPLFPIAGDAYIASATWLGWTKNHIYTWDGVSAWSDTAPHAGMLVWVDDAKEFYYYDGDAWGRLATAVGSHYHTMLVFPGTHNSAIYIDPDDGGIVFVGSDGTKVKTLLTATNMKKFKWNGVEWEDLFDTLQF